MALLRSYEPVWAKGNKANQGESRLLQTIDFTGFYQLLSQKKYQGRGQGQRLQLGLVEGVIDNLSQKSLVLNWLCFILRKPLILLAFANFCQLLRTKKDVRGQPAGED
jgi:hypothetical protein